MRREQELKDGVSVADCCSWYPLAVRSSPSGGEWEKREECVCVCVCVREKENERECLSVYEKERETDRDRECVCVYEWERGCVYYMTAPFVLGCLWVLLDVLNAQAENTDITAWIKRCSIYSIEEISCVSFSFSKHTISEWNCYQILKLHSCVAVYLFIYICFSVGSSIKTEKLKLMDSKYLEQLKTSGRDNIPDTLYFNKGL